MNHIYRLIWSKACNTLVVAAENTNGQGKGGGRSAPVASLLTGTLLALGLLSAQAKANCLVIPSTTIGYSGPYSADCNVVNAGTSITGAAAPYDVQSAALNIPSNTAMGSLSNAGAIDGGVIYVYNPATRELEAASGYLVALQIASSTISGNISNSGTLRAMNDGLVITNSHISGSIINSGTIAAEGSAIYIDGSFISGGFTNASGGLITGGNQSITISNTTVSLGITNNGQISDGSLAVELYQDTISGGITNTGTIGGVMDLGSNGTGLELDFTNLTGDITNGGLIKGDGAGLIIDNSSTLNGNINNSGTITANFDALAIADGTLTGSIINSVDGTINGGRYGITITTTSSVGGDIANSGSITGGMAGIRNSGTIGGSIINNAGGLISGIINNGVIGGSITNAGTIASSANDGIYVDTNSVVTNGITNSGSIAGVVNALNLQNTNNPFTVVNTGTLGGAVNLGINTLNLNGGVVNGAVSGTSASTVNIGGTIASNGALNVGTININPGASFTMNNPVAVTNGGLGLFTNAGTLNVTNAQTITGNYSQTGNYSIGVLGTSPGSYSQLNVTGNASFSGAYSFDIGVGSTLIAGHNYLDIFSATNLAGFSAKSGAFISGGLTYNYSIVQDAVNSTWLDLSVADSAAINASTTGYRVPYNATSYTISADTSITNTSAGGVALTIANIGNMGSLVNAGTLTGQNMGIFFDATTLSGGINNSGTISGGVLGIYIDPTIITGGITNTGTIMGGQAGLSIFYSSVSDGISNSGVINGGTYGIYIDANSTLTGNITNTGTISGGTNSLALLNASNPFTVVNTGTLGGAVNLGINTLNLNGGVVNGPVTGDSTSAVNIGGTIASNGAFNVGVMNINPGASFTMNNPVAVTNGGLGLFTNAGNLNVTNAQTITGNYLQTGNYSILISSQTNYSQLHVSGSASFSGTAYGLSISNGSNLLSGHNYLGVLSASSISGYTTKTGAYSSNGTTYSYSIVQDGTNSNWLDLDVTSITPPDPPSPPIPPTPITTNYVANVTSNNNPAALGAASALNAVAVTQVASMAGVVTALNTLSGSAQSNAISQTLPAITGATNQAMLTTLQGFNQIISGRQNAVAGLSSGEDFVASQNIWMKGYGSWANQNEQSGVAGYKINTGGFVLGGDTTLNPRSTVGAAFAFSSSNVNSGNNNASSSVNISGYQAGVYGDYAIDPKLNWSYQLDGSFSNNKESRNLSAFSGVAGVTGTNANANFNSTTEHVGTGLRQMFDLSDKTSFIPSVRADYSSIQSKAYSEGGAGVLNLNVNGQNTQALYVSTNMRVDHELTENLKVTANVGVGYNTLNNQVQLTAAYQGGGMAFVTNGLSVSPWLYNTGLGIVGQLLPNTEISVRYDVQTSPTGYVNNMASAKMRMVF